MKIYKNKISYEESEKCKKLTDYGEDEEDKKE